MPGGGGSVWGLLSLTTLALLGRCQELDFENVPGVAMEYRVHVDAGKEDCYYQYVHPGASLFISFWVIRGGDGMAGFAVRHPNGNHVHPYKWLKDTEYEEEKSVGGYYELCIDNQFSRFADKLVNMYLTTFRHDQWDKFTAEVSAMTDNVANFTTIIAGVNQRIQEMQKYQQISRSNEKRDLNLLESNFQYVTYWSLAQVLVVLVTGMIQVVFVRRLFDTKATYTLKPSTGYESPATPWGSTSSSPLIPTVTPS